MQRPVRTRLLEFRWLRGDQRGKHLVGVGLRRRMGAQHGVGRAECTCQELGEDCADAKRRDAG